MAQTMRLASFGPVYIVTTFHLPHIAYYNLNKLIKCERKKKHLLMAQTDAFRVVWAHCCRLNPCHGRRDAVVDVCGHGHVEMVVVVVLLLLLSPVAHSFVNNHSA